MWRLLIPAAAVVATIPGHPLPELWPVLAVLLFAVVVWKFVPCTWQYALPGMVLGGILGFFMYWAVSDTPAFLLSDGEGHVDVGSGAMWLVLLAPAITWVMWRGSSALWSVITCFSVAALCMGILQTGDPDATIRYQMLLYLAPAALLDMPQTRVYGMFAVAGIVPWFARELRYWAYYSPVGGALFVYFWLAAPLLSLLAHAVRLAPNRAENAT